MDPETVDGRFLWCSHERFTTAAKHVHTILDNHPASEVSVPKGAKPVYVGRLYDPERKVQVVSYDMERFAKGCVTAFCELSGYALNKVGTAPTPSLDEANDPLLVIDEPVPKGAANPNTKPTSGKGKPVPKGAATPTPGTGSGGALSDIACKVLMKIMYIARFARADLLRAVGVLTTMITKWDELCDRKLFRIIKYMNGTAAWRQIGFVGDPPEELEIGLYSDADVAGDKATQKKHLGCLPRRLRPSQLLPALCAEQEADRCLPQHGRGRTRLRGPRDPHVGFARIATVGTVTQPPTSPGSLPRQPGHGPNHDDGSCSNAAPLWSHALCFYLLD